MSTTKEIDRVEAELIRVRQVLANFITWTAQSEASPISVNDAKMLLRDLEPKEPR